MRVAITQRVEVVAGYGDRRDCLNQSWTGLLCQTGCDMIPVPNSLPNVKRWLKKKQVEALILTGGNDLAYLSGARNSAPERDDTEKRLLQWAAEHRIPVLGVCRGMQKLNHYLGGSLSPVTHHVATKHAISPVENEALCNAFSFVNSFHDWGIKPSDLSPCLRALAVAEDGTIEAAVHLELPWVGIMWHPERDNGSEKNNDIALIKKVVFEVGKGSK
jgi:putative glutamine amidotransferase